MGARILLVEDDRETRRLVASLLSEEGYAVDAVGRRTNAAAAARAVVYDAVVLDLGLPDGDGIELCREWRRAGMELGVAVNLSAHQFRVGSVVQLVKDAIRTTSVDPSDIDVEITESALVSNTEDTVSQLHAIREMGVGIALDDFGTGYSALGYLKSFPITQIKIDRVFVREIATDLQDAAITAAIVSLARGLDIEVIAEGVETAPQLAVLERQGCRLMQGYLFGRPVPEKELRRLVHERKLDGWAASVRR